MDVLYFNEMSTMMTSYIDCQVNKQRADLQSIGVELTGPLPRWNGLSGSAKAGGGTANELHPGSVTDAAYQHGAGARTDQREDSLADTRRSDELEGDAPVARVGGVGPGRAAPR